MHKRILVFSIVLLLVLCLALGFSCKKDTGIPEPEPTTTLTTLQTLNAKLDALLSQQQTILNEINKLKTQIAALKR